ncbi:MAG: CD1871A family CXXC motif-containing protein [Clostridia bacterium]
MRRHVFLVSLVASISLITIGVLAGDPARVFANAVVLCLSCIGIQ